MRLRGRPVTVTDDALLEAAREVFLSRGLEATTSEIARRADISESVIFYRYKTKEALFAAVFERQFELPPAFAALAQTAGTDTVSGHLFEAGRGLIGLMGRIMPFMMMAFASPAKLSMVHQRSRKPDPVVTEMIAHLSGYFRAECRLGRLRKVNAEVMAWTFLGSISNFVWMESCQRLAPPTTATTNRFLRGVIELLLGVDEKTTTTKRQRPKRS